MSERSRTAALITGAVGGSLVTLLLTRVAEARAAGPPPGVDPETWEMYLTIIETTAVQAEQVSELVVTLNNLVVTLGGEVIAENPSKITTGQLLCPVVGQGYQLPPIIVPWDKELIVKALPANTMNIFIANTQADAQNWNVAYPLIFNEAIGYKIRDASRLWVSAQIINEGITYTVEQD